MPPKRIVNKPPTASDFSHRTDAGSNEEDENQMFDELNEGNLQKNMRLLARLRTYSSVSTGIAVGIFGFSGLNGLIFYLIMFFIVTAFILLKTKFNIKQYFLNEADVLYGGIFNDIFLFIMMWVISHNLVNIL